MTFVTPTRRMVIKVSQHVDGRGRVYHPYMADWSATSTLVDLFQNLIMLFSKEPPVYSTPASAAPAPASGTPLTASPQMSLGSASMSTLPHVGTPRMSSLPSVGTMSMNSLPQSVPITMSVPAASASASAAAANPPRPNSAMPHSLSFARPASSVENDLASLSVQASAVNHSASSPGMMHLPHSPIISVDTAEHGIAKPSVSKGTDHHTPPNSDSGPSQNPQQQQQQNQQHSNDQHQNSYKFNPVAGRPPVPNLNPAAGTTNSESVSTATTTGGTSTMASLKPRTSAPGAHRYSCASESDTMSERAKRWSTTDSALSFTEDPDEEQTPSNALPTTLPASTAAVSPPINAPASVAANVSSTTVVLTQTNSGAAEAATTSTASPVPISSPTTTAAKVTASPMRAQPQSSLLDDEPMDDPQKRLLGYQLAMLDKVIKAVDKSREKHTRVNKELLDQSANLNSGAGVIAEERHQLLESQRQLSANIGVLENKLAELNEKKNEFPDVSQIKDVCQIFRGQMPAMEQLFNLAGEISAIDDTIYVLGKALNDGKLPVSVYMRQIRKLAQQQFMAKALAFKIRELCSLDKQ
ncbi:suppressor protein stp22 of temperature-sensitive alpha-factor receptor and arginine permease [Coemansia sp. RSA 2559]|nr:suppressor protein stp22 of temperature-sensitive alpha-factor receptor and arginine permease [Coemansia sp. RSA 2559]